MIDLFYLGEFMSISGEEIWWRRWGRYFLRRQSRIWCYTSSIYRAYLCNDYRDEGPNAGIDLQRCKKSFIALRVEITVLVLCDFNESWVFYDRSHSLAISSYGWLCGAFTMCYAYIDCGKSSSHMTGTLVEERHLVTDFFEQFVCVFTRCRVQFIVGFSCK